MPAVKTKRISTLIESQLPEFISSEYELFSKFVEKYYEAQEVQGGTLDIINNIQKYADIDYYEKRLLKQYTELSVTVNATETIIVVDDASSFPEKNGYIRINDEIMFYETRTETEFRNCHRGVSGNTSLGDLYESSTFTSTDAASHNYGAKVYNVSNLFLYAFVKNFESQYLGSFPEKYLKGEVDKRTLIKNINKFYKAKGTKSSIKFIFNTIISKDAKEKPEVYNPTDFTLKSSDSDWTNIYALKVKVVSGDVNDLIGNVVVQEETEEYGYVSATVDNVIGDITADGEAIVNLVLAPETVTGEFAISTKTSLTKTLSNTTGIGKRVNVFSTIGWKEKGKILIGEEVISFNDKNVTQFTIERRGDVTYTHEAGTPVYKPVIIKGANVELITLGVVYDFQITDAQPYSYPKDKVQISIPGFQTADNKITQTGSNIYRWILNNNLPIKIPTKPTLEAQLSSVSSDVSAIFADDQYYYITSSSFPSYEIFKEGVLDNQPIKDQKLLRILRKEAIKTTEKYATPKSEVGLLLNGVRLYGYKDKESVRYGNLESVSVVEQGSGYAKPPFVLVDGVPDLVQANLSGSVVESYTVTSQKVFPVVPTIEVTSGRGAIVRAVVTGDKVTSLIIDNAGEFYSSPPIVRITDNNGKGRFADFTAIVDVDGRITGFEKNAEGVFYNQSTVRVDIIPVGSNAKAQVELTEWNFNRYEKYKSVMDDQNGYVFENFNISYEYGYGQFANPKAFRYALNDNITANNQETGTLTHSPIIGFAYDGNPIYGPYGFEDPLDATTGIVRMTSSYVLNATRRGGPGTNQYPLGTFTNDYTYRHKNGSLDENNGRFCVTPDFPEGVYAYFTTINSDQVPQFPYILGKNFYSLPVDSNYNSNINQNDIPKKSRRLNELGMPGNGEGVIAEIGSVKPGTVDNVTVERSADVFSVNSKLYFDNRGTDGDQAEALVESVKGQPVEYIDSYENKVVKLTTIQNAYLFEDDTLRQPSSNASGVIVGEVRNDNQIVLKNVIGTFDNTGTFSADIKTFFILLDQKSSYTKGAILSLTDGVNPAVAKGEILNGTSSQNTVEIKVTEGDWVPLNQGRITATSILPNKQYRIVELGDTNWDQIGAGLQFQVGQEFTSNANEPTGDGIAEEIGGDYFLQSSDFFNTSGSKPVVLTSLSDNLEPFEVNQSVALIETSNPHGLGIDDKITVDIRPDDSIKTKDYYVRKRLYQNVVLKTPEYESEISDTGIGAFQILNGGADYAPATYTDVALTGGSGTGATATIVVKNNVVSDLQVQGTHSGYRDGVYNNIVISGGDGEGLVASLTINNGKIVGNKVYVKTPGYNYVGGSFVITNDDLPDYIKVFDDDGLVTSTGLEIVATVSATVATVDITNKGTGYRKGDYLSVDDEDLSRSVASRSTARLSIYVDHVGFAEGKRNLVLKSTTGLAIGDLIKIGSEILEVTTIDSPTEVTVNRGIEGSEDTNHYDGQTVTLYKAQYNFPENFQVGGLSTSGKVLTYDRDTQSVVLVYNYGIERNTATSIQNSSTFFDGSTPARLVTVSSIESPNFKFEISEDNITFTPNPNIQIQEFYRYKFDTSHSSLTGTYFDLSPSRAYNLITEEKLASTTLPGNEGAFTEVKFGFGPRIAENQYDTKVGTDFTTFYYFDKNGVVTSDDAYLELITDPLQGEKTVIYVTPTRIVYNVATKPLWDGSGVITYTSKGAFSIGEINTVKVTNLGLNYKKVPVITGVDITPTYKATAEVEYDEKVQIITGITVTEGGSNYTNPVVVITDGDGQGARFKPSVTNGKISIISVENAGKGYTYKPTVEIIESDAELYVDSNTIGVPQSIKIVRNGGAFHLDKTVASSFTSHFTVALKRPSSTETIGVFQRGEVVTQTNSAGREVFRAVVSEFKVGTNLLKLKQLQGIVRNNFLIVSVSNPTNKAAVKAVYSSTLTENITSSYDNAGFYNSARGKVSDRSQRITDSFFYQDYSYVVKSRTPIDQWRDLIKSTTHPAGFKLFGQVDIETDANTRMPAKMPRSGKASIIQLWNPEVNTITSDIKQRVITQSIQKIENNRVRRGPGAIASSEFNFNEFRAYTVSLDKKFNGVLAEDFLGETPVSQTNIQDTFSFWIPTINDYSTIDVSNGDTFVFYKMSVAGNSFEGIGLDLSPNGYPDTRDFSAWEYAYSTGSIPQLIPDNRSEIQGSYFNIPSGANQFEIIKSKRGSINPDYSDLNAEPFLIDTENYGRVFTVWFQNDNRIEDLFQDFSVNDIIRWYPVPSNRDAWIDLKVDAVDIDPSYVESSTGVIGRKTFQLLNDNGDPFTPPSAKNLIITLDGVLQDPGVAYTVSGDTITFAEPPLGPYQKLTGSRLGDLTEYDGMQFYGRYFAFKDTTSNDRYLRKIRNIFQRNGRWLDSANQIERNLDFIISESIGYGKEIHPTLDWSTKGSSYESDLRNILKAYEHDLRFGGNVKTVDYLSYFNEDNTYDYITDNKVPSLDIFRYATNLSKLAIRNWDIVVNNVNFIQGSRILTMADTNNVAVGMLISAGGAFPEGTRISSIDSETQITLTRAALSNSGGGGGAPAGTTTFDGTTDGDATSPTSTAAVEPGDTFIVDEGDTFSVPPSFSGSDTATFYFSGINTGTFYDAANLIAANKAYLQEEVSATIYNNYTLQTTVEKCARDLGYLIDAIVYHLKFGGTEQVVEFGRLYYTNAGYPYGETLTHINRSVEETAAAIAAWDLLVEKMTLAMRNSLGAGTYTNIAPVTDPDVAIDSLVPACANVASALGSYIQIVKDILAFGTGYVNVTPQNLNSEGNWTSLRVYTNYNIIEDPLLPDSECADVISSVDSLFANVTDILNEESVSRSLPDYVDGETKEFELYWEDGTEVNSEEDEDFFITINAVLQQPKYNATYPGGDAYYIDRTVIPNKIVFDVAPIWDQDFGAKSIGEPTAVERVVGLGVGNYKRLTIDYNLVDGVRSGPFLILDMEDRSVQKIDEKEFLYVFVDGVLQREGYSYTISGPNIYFNVPIKEQNDVDMRLLYGRDVGQILNIYDYSPNTYYIQGDITFTLDKSTTFATEAIDKLARNDDNVSYSSWMQDKRYAGYRAIGSKSDGATFDAPLGDIIDPYIFSEDGDIVTIKARFVVSQYHEIVRNQAYTDRYRVLLASIADSSITTTILINDIDRTITTDETGRIRLADRNGKWNATKLGRSYRKTFLPLNSGDTIKVDGESAYRKISALPSIVTSKDYSNSIPSNNSIFGIVGVEAYNGSTEGTGLSVVPIMETVEDEDGNKVLTGRIERLEWNQRNYNPNTQPTAYQYYTPPIIQFIPEDGNGGGAQAEVLTLGGHVLSVDLINPGSGYTSAPKTVVARGYDILVERDIAVSLVTIGIQPKLDADIRTVTSEVSIASLPVPLAFTSSAVIADSPRAIFKALTAIIQVEGDDNLKKGLDARVVQPLTKFTDSKNKKVQTYLVDMFLGQNEYVSIASTRTPFVKSVSITQTARKLTTQSQKRIFNDSLGNFNYYETGAYLDLDMTATDTVAYIADTSKFETNGYLMIGDEVVRYYRKLTDRFLSLQRGVDGTTPKPWLAGTFLKQIPKKVEVVSGGVAVIQSVASVRVKEVDSEVRFNEDNEFAKWFEPAPVSVEQKATLNERVITAQIQSVQAIDSLSYVTAKTQRKTDIGARKVIGLFSSLQADRTIIRGELQKQDIFFPAPVVTQTVVTAAAHKAITTEVTLLNVFSESVTVKPYASFEKLDSLAWKETLIEQDIKKEAVVPDVKITQIYAKATVRPTVSSTSQISIISEAISIAPKESFSAIESLAWKETLVKRDIKKEAIQIVDWKVTQTIVKAQVRPSIVSTNTTFLTRTEAITTRPSETFVSIDSLTHYTQPDRLEIQKADINLYDWRVEQTIVKATLRPSITSTNRVDIISEALSIAPQASEAAFGEMYYYKQPDRLEIQKADINLVDWKVTQTIVKAQVAPTVTSTSQISIVSDALSIAPKDSIASFNSLSAGATEVKADIKKDAVQIVDWKIAKTIIKSQVRPTVLATVQANIVTESGGAAGAGAINSEARFESLTRDNIEIKVDIKKSAVRLADWKVSHKQIRSSLAPTISSVSASSIEADAITTRPQESGIFADSVVRTTVNHVEELHHISIQHEVVHNGPTELLRIHPGSGVVDGFVESIFLSDPVPTRDGGSVDITDDHDVLQRDGDLIDVINKLFGSAGSGDYLGDYTTGNAGPTLRNWNYVGYDDGSANASGVSIERFSALFPQMTLADFEDRPNSSYTINGDYFNLANPSIQNAIAITSQTGLISGTIAVDNSGDPGAEPTKYFLDSGYLFTSGGSIIQYTSKTGTTFDGCTVYSGPTTISAGDEMINIEVD